MHGAPIHRPLESAWALPSAATGAARPRSSPLLPSPGLGAMESGDSAAWECMTPTLSASTCTKGSECDVAMQRAVPPAAASRGATAIENALRGGILVPQYRLTDIKTKRAEYLTVLPPEAVPGRGGRHMVWRRYSHFRALHAHYAPRLGRHVAGVLAAKLPRKTLLHRRTACSAFLGGRQEKLAAYLPALLEAVATHLPEQEWGALMEFLGLV
eukprot:TRINITY_DN25514_c0_g1_i1.p1 TRINITY_DN25514_c0_g1~~TRINITY_DN25514_c0_g1_i1.p1  ORF type:complete len:213 (+),score=36.37 TRINITY_DN25514_c0_g1_i1:79-717(+)